MAQCLRPYTYLTKDLNRYLTANCVSKSRRCKTLFCPSPGKHCTHICINKYTQTHELNLKTLFKIHFLWLERWLGSSERLLVLQAPWVCFPTPSSNGSQLSKLRGSDNLSTSVGSCTWYEHILTQALSLTHTHKLTQAHKHTHKWQITKKT